MNLAGVTMRTEHVQFLAALVDDDLAAKLNRAITNNNDIVALSAADREHLLELLSEATPGALIELRNVLVKQRSLELKRDAHSTRIRHDQARARSRAART